MTDKSAMTDAYAKSKARVEEGGGYDEDNWGNTTNPAANAACPNDNPLMEFGERVGTHRPLKWWVNYHWTKANGTYAYGDGWFRSNFDPKQFFVKSNNGLTLRAFGEEQDKCITSELVSEVLAGQGWTFLVTARADSGARSFAKLDPNLIFGIFTYQFGRADPNTTPNVHREMDLLETVSQKWAQKPGGNAQFAVQPWDHDRNNNLLRFSIPDTQYLTVWGHAVGDAAAAEFKVFAGDYSLDDVQKATPFQKWSVPPKYIPPFSSGCARFHINLYLAQGRPPGEEQRITITRIQLP